MFFNSRRSSVLSKRGMVATSQPLAAVAGLKMLMKGGNAIDGAVAAAAALAVVEPMSTGVGGDAFSLVWMAKEKKVHALNASGRAPQGASVEELVHKGFAEIPPTSPYSVSIPGTVDGWIDILERYGTMPISEVLEPAIHYAESGFPVSELIAHQWADGMEKLSQFPSGRELSINGEAPRNGQTVILSGLGKVLRDIAEGGRDAFYRGQIAEKIADFVQQLGGWITVEDLAQHHSKWEEPISTDYRGLTCWECPPNGQGLAALIALNIAEGFDFSGLSHDSSERYHFLIETMHLAFADALAYIADPDSVFVPTEQLISKSYAAERRSLISEKASLVQINPGSVTNDGDTVYISVVDGEGNACSFINSLYQGFGSGLVVPGTGIALQNRAALFSLIPDHPNVLAPGKRPFHTIIPAMATRDGELFLSYGVMGGFQQAQGHLQVINNIVDYGMAPQQSLDARRFSVIVGQGVALEDDMHSATVEGLRKLGHNISLGSGPERMMFGGAQLIQRDSESGTLWGASEPRKDGCAIGF